MRIPNVNDGVARRAPAEAELARQEGRDYEPASVLFERIRASRADAARESKVETRTHFPRASLTIIGPKNSSASWRLCARHCAAHAQLGPDE